MPFEILASSQAKKSNETKNSYKITFSLYPNYFFI